MMCDFAGASIKKSAGFRYFIDALVMLVCSALLTVTLGSTNVRAADGVLSSRKQMGRIEELVEQAGASPPMVLQKEEPRFDTGEPQEALPKPVTLQGQVLNSYPLDWRGTWSGKVQVVKFDMNPVVWKGDPLTTFRMKSLLRKGKEGSLTVFFKEDEAKNLSLEPPEIVFHVFARNDPLSVILHEGKAASQENADAVRKQATYALSFVGFSGLGLSGNIQNNEVVRNRIARLSPAVIEQDIFTQGQSINRFTQEVTKGYFETVLQLEAIDEHRLAINAASVCYYETGIFEYKLIVEGVLEREGWTEPGGKL